MQEAGAKEGLIYVKIPSLTFLKTFKVNLNIYYEINYFCLILSNDVDVKSDVDVCELTTLLTLLFQDRAISEDPCFAVKEVTKMIAKWSERFMSDCGSHQKNPQIPKKMDKFKTKMLAHLRSQAGYDI